MSEATKYRLICATRQYRHNTDNSPDICNPKEGFVNAYDREEVDALVGELQADNEALRARVAKQQSALEDIDSVAHYEDMKGELERLRNKAGHCQQQAQIWKQEARTQSSIVAEMYQILTGATGEPGDWNGAKPLRAAILRKQAESVEEIVDWSPDGESATGNDLVATDSVWDYAQSLRSAAEQIERGR